MDLDPSDQKALTLLVDELHELHGDGLLSVSLTGDAVGAAYQPRKTELATIVVLEEVSPDALRETRSHIRRWRRRNLSTPMMMDPHYIESALDVFPLEFLEIRERHVQLCGDRDPFADLRIDVDHLRLAVEEQLRGKLLHLWGAYLSTEGSEKHLRALLVETPPGFEMVLRAMLKLPGGPTGTPDDDALVAAVESRFGLELPSLRRLVGLHTGRGSLAGDELDPLCEGYLAEVRSLVQVIDAL